MARIAARMSGPPAVLALARFLLRGDRRSPSTLTATAFFGAAGFLAAAFLGAFGAAAVERRPAWRPSVQLPSWRRPAWLAAFFATAAFTTGFRQLRVLAFAFCAASFSLAACALCQHGLLGGFGSHLDFALRGFDRFLRVSAQLQQALLCSMPVREPARWPSLPVLLPSVAAAGLVFACCAGCDFLCYGHLYLPVSCRSAEYNWSRAITRAP
ncbi:hypothetical protein ACU4GH_15475 [Bradyrhizobium betae]